MSCKGDRGKSISYAALIVLIGSVFALVSTSGIPGKVAKGCEGALCRLSGRDCSNNLPQAQARGFGEAPPIRQLLSTSTPPQAPSGS